MPTSLVVAVLLTQQSVRVFRWFDGECCVFKADDATMDGFPVGGNERSYRLRYITSDG